MCMFQKKRRVSCETVKVVSMRGKVTILYDQGTNKVSEKTARVASVKGNIWDTAKDVCKKDRVGRLQGLPI